MKEELTHQALTVRLGWKERKSTRVYLHWKSVSEHWEGGAPIYLSERVSWHKCSEIRLSATIVGHVWWVWMNMQRYHCFHFLCRKVKSRKCLCIFYCIFSYHKINLKLMHELMFYEAWHVCTLIKLGSDAQQVISKLKNVRRTYCSKLKDRHLGNLSKLKKNKTFKRKIFHF